MTSCFFRTDDCPHRPNTQRRNNSGNFAIFAAIRRASSWLSNFAAERRPGASSK
jgi:hypothetical protein